MQTLSIIIPVYNEEKLIGKVIDSVVAADSLGFKKEIIIVDDGSTDGTVEKIKNYIDSRFHGNDKKALILSIFKKKNEGKGAALKAGFEKATGDILLVQDADGEYSPNDYPSLLKPLIQNKTDVVYGTRNKERTKNKTQYSYLSFYWGGIILTWFINLLFGIKLTDQATGYKLFSNKLKSLLLSPKENGFSYEVAVTGLLANARYAIHEVPIHYSPRSLTEGKKIGALDFIESIFVGIKYFFLKGIKKPWESILFLIPIGLILFFWSDTLSHLSTQIHDWMDGTFMIWTIQNNISHFTSFALSKIYDTNAMYPFRYSLSMTDHFYFPSLIATFVSFFSKNYFLQFNLLTVGNHILLYLSFFLLAGRFTKNSGTKALSAFYFSFGPYFFLQMGHLQMVFMWPLVLSLYYVFDDRKSIISQIKSGVWMGLQFLTGTYLGVMGLAMIGLYYTIRFFKEKNKIEVLKNFGIFFFSFLLVAGVSIYGYFLVNATYHPVRDQGQYVSYAAHITDYLFPNINSFIYSLMGSWTNLNKHISSERAAFVGFLPLIIGIWALVKSIKNGNFWLDSRLRGNDKVLIVWLIILVVIGFIFSLGPRFNWNGVYKVFPLPYLVLLKAFPPLGIIRATARWYVFIHFAVSIGITICLSQITSLLSNKKRNILIFTLCIFAVLEFYPPRVQTIARDYKRPSDLFLQQQCQQDNGPILEYPFEYRAEDRTVEKFLAAKTNTLMYSTLHTCPTLSGFSSFEPLLFLEWQKDFDTNGITDSNVKILRDNKFKYIRVSLNSLKKSEKENPQLYMKTKGIKLIYQDNESAIYRIL